MLKMMSPASRHGYYCFLLCITVCIQVLGAPGTLFDFTDTDDVFHATVLTGYAIASAASAVGPALVSSVIASQTACLLALLRADVLFHPPLVS